MKRLSLISCLAVLALAQTNPSNDQIDVRSQQQTIDGPIRHYAGNVRIETPAVLITADRADFNARTNEVLARGDVHIKLK